MYQEKIDIDAAMRTIEEMNNRSQELAGPLVRAEDEMKNALLGLILTSIETGLIQNTPARLEEMRGKIYVAFSMGFVKGKEI